MHTTRKYTATPIALGALALAAALGLSGCTENTIDTLEVGKSSATVTIDGFAADASSILVKFRNGPSLASMQNALDLVAGKFEDKNKDLRDDRFQAVAGGRLAELALDPAVSVKDALALLSGHPAIEYAEPNYIVQATVIPNDTRFSELWGMNNTGQTGGTPDADIDAPEAWDTTTGSRDIIVGVIDTGVDYNHPDLAANIWTNPGEIAGNGIDDDGNGIVDDIHGFNAITGTGDPLDDNDHGSHCSGTIGGAGNNNQGVAGVNWEVSIIGMKFLSSSGSGTTADAIEAVNYAVDLKENHGIDIRVLSNSWGGGGFSQALLDAIVAADAADIMFVAAAGNSSLNNDTSANYPSNYDSPNVVAVASTTNTDALSSFSNYGASTVDLGAPGSSILSTIPGGGYANFSGTSMATPHVAGAAALVLSYNSNLTTAEVKQILMDSGDAISALAGKTVSGKRLNVNNALAATPAPGPNFKMTLSPAGQTIGQGQSASYTIDVTPISGFTGNVTLSLSSNPALNASTSFSVNPIATSGSSTLTINTSTATAAGSYTLSITGTSGAISNSRTVTLTVDPEGTVTRSYPNTTVISIPDNNPTGITSTTSVTDSQSILEVSVEVNITHTWIGDLTVDLVSPAGTTVRLHDRAGGSADNINQTYTLPSQFDGEDSNGNWRLIVTDLASVDVGTLDSWTLTIKGPDNGGPPANNPPTASFTSSTSNLTASFTDASSDSDGTIVSRSWNFGDGGTSTAQNPSHTYGAAGTYTVTLTVTDDDGASATASASVTVTAPPAYTLSVATRTQNRRKFVDLSWSGATGSNVDVYRDNVLVKTTANDGFYSDSLGRTNETTFVYRVCNAGTSVCSNDATAQF